MDQRTRTTLLRPTRNGKAGASRTRGGVARSYVMCLSEIETIVHGTHAGVTEMDLVGGGELVLETVCEGSGASYRVYGDATGRFCLAVDYGTAGVQPSVIEAASVFDLADVLKRLNPVLAALGLSRV